MVKGSLEVIHFQVRALIELKPISLRAKPPGMRSMSPGLPLRVAGCLEGFQVIKKRKKEKNIGLS